MGSSRVSGTSGPVRLSRVTGRRVSESRKVIASSGVQRTSTPSWVTVCDPGVGLTASGPVLMTYPHPLRSS